eukprot:TRINITY_DN3434_c0_g1_i1.p1 TRINITY_DN3434_c0_g1~~TRINITY_DN3434_c0_g1_i1.p1  ORF type:complete len:908 (+),score=371.86 TRINITY_DN3434_c0_g1_i1:91-2814(+)
MNALDEIVSAVADIILIFEEAQQKLMANIVMSQPAFERLVSEIHLMVREQDAQSIRIPDVSLRAKMNSCNQTLTNDINELRNLVARDAPLNNGTYTIPRKIYDDFHRILKSIIHEMVKQLQVIDACNVQIVIGSSRQNLELLVRLRNATTIQAVDAVDAEIQRFGQNFQEHVAQRIRECTDLAIRDRLVHSTELLRNNQPNLAYTASAEISAPSAQTKHNRDTALKASITALQDVVSAVMASSKYISDFSLIFELPPSLLDGFQRTPQIEDALRRLEAAVRRGDHAAALQAIQDLIAETQRQIQEGKLFASKMKDPVKQQEYLRDLNELEQVVGKITNCYKKALAGDKDALKELDQLIERCRLLNNKIQAARNPETEMLDSQAKLESCLAKLMAAAKRGDANATVAASKEFLELIKDQVARGRAVAAECTDPAIKQQINDACDELDRLAPLILSAVKQVLANPNDMAAQRNLEQLMDQAKLANGRLNAAVVEAELHKNKGIMDELFDKLDEAVMNRDKGAADERLKDIQDMVNRRTDLGNKLAELTSDPSKKKQILDAVALMNSRMNKLPEATHTAIRDPTQQNIDKFREVARGVQDAAARVTANKVYPQDVYDEAQSAAARLEQSMSKLMSAVRRGDKEAAERHLREVDEQLARQAQLARDLAAKCENAPLKKQLLEAATKLDDFRGKIKQATQDALANPNDASKQAKLEGLLDEAKKVSDWVSETAERMRNDKSLTEKMAAVKVAPENELNPSGRKGDAVMDAAQSVFDAAHAKAYTKEHKCLLDIAQSIAREMALLSEAANKRDKQGMIEAAKRIAGMIGQCEQFSAEIASKCTDTRLRERLLMVCKLPKNFAVQLKIIAAVKSGSGDNDSSAKHQLVSCATSLANSVIETVKAAESAAIKCPK